MKLYYGGSQEQWQGVNKDGYIGIPYVYIMIPYESRTWPSDPDAFSANDSGALGFAATIYPSNDKTVDLTDIVWVVTLGNETRKTTSLSYGDTVISDGAVSIGLIITDIKDDNASAYAIYNGTDYTPYYD